MSKPAVKIASVFVVVLASTTASFARGAGPAATGHIGGGVRPNVGAAVGTAQSQVTDPSGMANARKVAPLPPPNINVPTVPQFK
jgi:hypothetical protein